MTLYELNEAIRNFEFDIDEETGEILNAGELDALGLAREEKAENVAIYIKNLRADAEALKAEKKVLAARQASIERKIDSLASYLGFCLEGKPLSTAKCVVSYRKSETVECDDISKVPEEYLKYASPTLDKTAIKAAIKEGKDTGCRLETHTNILIK